MVAHVPELERDVTGLAMIEKLAKIMYGIWETKMNDIEIHGGLRQGASNLNYLFFGGKGGVGKTVLAGATAIWLASQGRRTMLASTNPVHSLCGLLGQNVFGQPPRSPACQTCGLTRLIPRTRSNAPSRKSAKRSSGS